MPHLAKVMVTRVPPKPFDEEVFEAVQRVLDEFGVDKIVGSGDRVLVKPNICSDNLWITTDRKVYYSIAVYLKELGCKVTIGENPVINTPSKKVFEEMKELKKVAEKAGVEVVNLRFQGFKKVRVPNPHLFEELEVSEYALKADAIFSVPTMRKHGLSGLTLSLKNLFGLVSLRQRYIIHSRSLYWGLVEIAKVLKDKIKLVVIDGILATLNGSLVPTSILVGSDDMVAADAVTAWTLGWNPYKLEVVKYGEEAGVGVADLSKIELIGITWEELKEIREKVTPYFGGAWENPVKVGEKLGVEVVLGDPCPTCERNLSKVLQEYKPEDFQNAPKIAIIVGPNAKPVPGKLNIIVGECLKKYAGKGIFVSFCPVYTHDLKEALNYAIGKSEKITRLWEKLLVLIDKPI